MTSLDPKGLQAAFRPDPEMFVCMDQTGCYYVSWNEADHRAKMAQLGAVDEARYVRVTTPSGEVEGLDNSIAFLLEAAVYFSKRPTGGEDAVHWSNVLNSENCTKASTALASMKREVERLTHEVESAGALRLRMEAHRQTALAAEARIQVLEEALATIADTDEVEAMLDPTRLIRIAGATRRAASQALGRK